MNEQEDTKPKRQVACLVCFKPATWEKYGFAYCNDHIPKDAENFEPEAHEVDVIDAYKKLGTLTENEQNDIQGAWQKEIPRETEEDRMIDSMLKRQRKRTRT